jgi:hypothetical protein
MFPIYIHKKVLYEDLQHLKDFKTMGNIGKIFENFFPIKITHDAKNDYHGL